MPRTATAPRGAFHALIRRNRRSTFSVFLRSFKLVFTLGAVRVGTMQLAGRSSASGQQRQRRGECLQLP